MKEKDRVEGERATGEEGKRKDTSRAVTYPCALRQNLVRARFCLCFGFILYREVKKMDGFSSENIKQHISDIHRASSDVLNDTSCLYALNNNTRQILKSTFIPAVGCSD